MRYGAPFATASLSVAVTRVGQLHNGSDEPLKTLSDPF